MRKEIAMIVHPEPPQGIIPCVREAQRSGAGRPERIAGFSLVESLMTLLISMALGLGGIQAYTTCMSAYRLETAAYGVYVDLQEARLQAIKKNDTVQMAFGSSCPSYQSVDGNTKTLPKGISIISVTQNPSFFPRGNSSGGTIAIGNDQGSRDIVVNSKGRIIIK